MKIEIKILNPKKASDRRDIHKLKRSGHIFLVDRILDQSEELFKVRNPRYRFSDPEEFKDALNTYLKSKNLNTMGNWVYYPWNHSLVHILEKKDFNELRAARNRDLITTEEQAKLSKTTIGVAGLSVGNSAALALVLESIGHRLKLADFDMLSLSNLNRIRAGVRDLGLNKAVITGRQILELSPYTDVQIFSEGLNKNNLSGFIRNSNLVVEETDDLSMKIEIRKACSFYKVPLISAADNGTGTILDVERYDLNKKLKPFHGRIKAYTADELQKMGFEERLDLINKMVGFEYVGQRMKSSLKRIGKEIYSWPQLGGAAQFSGAAIAAIAKDILLGKKVKSGKYNLPIKI